MADTAGSSTGGGDAAEQQQQQQPEQTRQVPTDPAQIAASAISLPSGEQHQWRGRDVVFVDPLDSTVPYWWPAMIVPTEEIDATMGCTGLGPSEYLVKYFEDFKYSTVNGSELRLFDTSQVPYTDFAAKSPQFLKDKAIKSALSYMRTGLVHAKFQWKLWQTGSETLSLPFVLDTAISAATESNTVASAQADDATTMAVDEESDGSTLVTNLPQDPTSAVSTASGNPDGSADAAEAEAVIENRGGQQDEGDGNVSPNTTTPETASPPRQTQQQQQQQKQPTTRARRGRQPRVAANGTGTGPTTSTGTGRRGRPPLASKQNQSQNGAKHKRNSSAAVTSAGSGRRGPTVITDSMSMLAEESDNPSASVESSEIRRIVREMTDVQEEYRFFKELVKRAAKDLWSEMGNEWPPNLGSSTRFGKRRKLA
ncbi:hypothetical protein GGI15_003531 [Coemansia interrupta]|uniref:PWWP domain-containing protein n=1 Tax=Coemansia interrupta TaxID=1126814 RepID=A0A9W8H705_9FUNG|nr:hypothetical protein GGI15_003531 [Coemansia interrupta]